MQANQILANADVIYSNDEINNAVKKIAAEITLKLQDTAPVVICVMSGGLVFAGHLLTHLRFPLELDYVHASRYQNNTAGNVLHWKALPQCDLANRTVLLVDDILDVGITLFEIAEKCKHLGAKVVYKAVLVDKALNTQKPIKADFVGLSVPNAYVFGYGMDAFCWWRNLPDIYALKS